MTSKTTVSSTTKRKIGKSTKRVPIIDTSQARSNIQVLRMCLQELGWKECIIGSSTEPDIHWHAGTFHDDNKNFKSTSARINKFPDGSEGEGIFLIQDSTRCTMVNRPYIIQEYVDRPLLINGLKFDMRIYVLILKLDPLEVLLYDEVIKRGYKAMSNRPFRNFASICGIIDESITMPSIDLLYIQIFNKCKEYASQSPATGTHRKYSFQFVH
ncbi:unnamed protein product [Rotaria sordida]|uniref:Uncharacterized protein n=1 Tax=Rotaria sordida TaxID=392033 RepID=A0A814YYI4_9BILA|nr:unnamed protein product [Rotaria sordida]